LLPSGPGYPGAADPVHFLAHPSAELQAAAYTLVMVPTIIWLASRLYFGRAPAAGTSSRPNRGGRAAAIRWGPSSLWAPPRGSDSDLYTFSATLSDAAIMPVPSGFFSAHARLLELMPKDVILTPEGLANLKAELDHMSTTRRREVAAASKRPANSAISPRTPSTTTPRTSRPCSRRASPSWRKAPVCHGDRCLRPG